MQHQDRRDNDFQPGDLVEVRCDGSGANTMRGVVLDHGSKFGFDERLKVSVLRKPFSKHTDNTKYVLLWLLLGKGKMKDQRQCMRYIATLPS